jgi:Peroxidase, family 2
MRPIFAVTLLGAAQQVLAFPALAEKFGSSFNGHSKRVLGIAPGFDAEAQHIDVSGEHAFVPPGHEDLRGPCPGLNALANHNYLPHSGLATIDQFITATNQVFGMGLDLATFLAIYGAIMDGDLTSWSIGGPPPSSGLLSGLLSQPRGISYSHNKYEGDVSPTRGDLYLYGNDYLLQLAQFQALYAKQSSVPDSEANYDLDVLTQFRVERFQQSLQQNPYFFNGPFSGVAVQPAAYTFIYRFFANHSASNPEGILSKEVLKSFFAISGDEGEFTYTPGYEQIPQNWYRRAVGDEYTIPYFAIDANTIALQHPEFLSVGGNTGTVDSFVGVDPADLTGGVFNAQSLLEGNNAICFAFQAAVLQAPDLLKGLVSDVTGAVAALTSALGDSLGQLDCPQLEKFDDSQLEQFPGYGKLKGDGTYSS